MDKFYAMHAFRSVVESGSFSKAAEKMGLSTTTTSRLVADLEKQLGTSLLHRSTRRINLTDPGLAYFQRCCQHLDDIALTEFEIKGQNASLGGTLRLSVPSCFGKLVLAPRLIGFIHAHPGLNLEIRFSDRAVDLAEDGIDVAVRICQQVPEMLVARPLARIRRVLCASPDYLARHGSPVTPDDLRNHRCLYYLNLAERQHWVFQKDGQEIRVPISGALRANSGEMLRIAAVAGGGIIMEPYFIVGEDLRAGRLVPLLPAYQLETRSVFAVFQHAGRYSAKTRTFVDYLCRTFEDPAVAALL